MSGHALTAMALTAIVRAAIVRAVVLGVGISSYYLLLPVLFRDDGSGANIGAGLIGFALVVVACGIWGLVDGMRQPVTEACMTWLLVSLLVGAAWTVGLTAAEAGSWADFGDLLRINLEQLPFTTALVLVPAIVAVLTGQGAHGARHPESGSSASSD